MKLPIVAYGDPVLKKIAEDITVDYLNLNVLINNMFDTMYAANGVGLAAPQIGLPIRLFIIDTTPFDEEESVNPQGVKKVFINAIITEESGNKWTFNEGCLSIPDVREDVSRQSDILITYHDEHWVLHKERFSSLMARVIQHEYDHIEGKLFTDRINPLRKTMLKSKLDAISKGEIKVDYKMRFPNNKRKR